MTELKASCRGNQVSLCCSTQSWWDSLGVPYTFGIESTLEGLSCSGNAPESGIVKSLTL